MIKPIYLYAGGGALVLIAALWLFKRGNAANLGAAVGGAAVDLVTGAVGGVAGGVATVANNPAVNPLQPFGAWLGSKIYDILPHTAPGV